MQHLIDICTQLSKEGKTPSTALVKARAPKGTSLQNIIQAVNSWRIAPANGDTKSNLENDVQSDGIPDDIAIPQAVEQRLNEMMQTISKLESRIAMLEKAIK